MKRVICAMVCGSVLCAAEKPAATKDLCVPPPSGSAPALPAKLLEGQGTVHFPITTSSSEAQKFFDQGVAQMHSFWAKEAERSFRQAAALDPEAPMPWWGVAMAAAGDYRPRFQLDSIYQPKLKLPRAENRATAAAEKALKLSQVPGKATPVERAYISTVVARRNRADRAAEESYTAALRTLVSQYPQEVEARSYLALHLMRGFTLPAKQPVMTSMEAVALLKQLLTDAPDHPGVHHYVIHGYEGSPFAADAWPSCRRYAELVPNIPHALHMPGHIYSQTGKWDEAVKSFAGAADLERSYMGKDKLYGNGHHGHNVHYLATSLSFQGKVEEALEQGKQLMTYTENPREQAEPDNAYTAYAQGWFATLRTLVQAERWDDLLAGRTLPEPRKARQQAWYHWARALAYSARQDAAAALRESKAMDVSLRDLRSKLKRDVPPELKVARQELAGHLSLVKAKQAKAIEQLQIASTMERRLRYAEPPPYPRPVAEALGQMALRQGKVEVAESAFQTALQQYPESAKAKQGLRHAQALRARPVEAGQ